MCIYKYIVIFLLIIISFFYFYMGYSKYYHGNISDHFDGTRFFDPELNNEKTFFDFLKWRITKKSSPWPEKVLNNQFDLPPARVMGADLRVSYVGHVTFLIQTQGLNILTDPVWSERASPVSFAGPKRVNRPRN